MPGFFNFPVSRARHEKLCDFYWLQLRIKKLEYLEFITWMRNRSSLGRSFRKGKF